MIDPNSIAAAKIAARTIFATPPKSCDLCKDDITDSFTDAMIPRYRQWGNVCPSCAKSEGVTLGTGRGQCYVRNADGKYYKHRG